MSELDLIADYLPEQVPDACPRIPHYLVRIERVSRFCGLSPSTIYAKCDDGSMPTPIRIGTIPLWYNREVLGFAYDREMSALDSSVFHEIRAKPRPLTSFGQLGAATRHRLLRMENLVHILGVSESLIMDIPDFPPPHVIQRRTRYWLLDDVMRWLLGALEARGVPFWPSNYVPAVQPFTPRMVPHDDAVAILSLSETSLRELEATGVLPPRDFISDRLKGWDAALLDDVMVDLTGGKDERGTDPVRG